MLLHNSSNILDTVTALTYQPDLHHAQSTFHMVWALDMTSSMAFPHCQLCLHWRFLGKLLFGLMDSGTRVVSTRWSPLPHVWAKAVLGAPGCCQSTGTVATPLVKAFMAHNS